MKTIINVLFILISIFVLILSGCATATPTEEAAPVAQQTEAPAEETAAPAEATEAPAEEPVTEQSCKIAIPWNTHNNWTMTTMHEAAIAEVEAQGCEALATVAGGDVTQHVANIEIATQQKVDGIIIGDANWQDVKGAVDAAIAEDIPVVSCDLGADTVLADITSDNTGIGKMMAEALVKNLGETGKVIVIYEPGYKPVDVRMDGFYAEMKNHTGIELLGPFPARFPNQVAEAKTQMEALLKQYGDGEINAVVASYDSQGVGAAQAIKEAGREGIIIVSADGDQEALESILAGGPFVFTVAQDMATMGKTAADIVISKIRGEEVQTGTIYVPAFAVDATNAAELLKERYGK